MDCSFKLEAGVPTLYKHVVPHMQTGSTPPFCVSTQTSSPAQYTTVVYVKGGGGVQGVYSLQGFKSISTIFGKNKNRR